MAPLVTIRMILLILAFICFILQTAGVASKLNLLSLGLALWVMAVLIT